MKNNLGKTRIKTRRRSSNSLQEFDSLPKALREWLRNAALPWRPLSVQRIYTRSLSDTGDPDLALEELDRRQASLLLKDHLI